MTAAARPAARADEDHLGPFAEGVRLWSRMIATASPDQRPTVFRNCIAEGAMFVRQGAPLGRISDELIERAYRHNLFDALGERAAVEKIVAEGLAKPDEDPRQDQSGPRVLPGTDYADMSTVSAKRWLVHHLLAVGEVSVPYGEPGSGKSVLAEDIGLHVAAGMAWHGRKVLRSAVLYVALERAAVVARRALAFGLEHGLVAAALPFKMIRGPLDFRDPKVVTEIVATITDLAARYRCPAGLLIVDTVSRALCGGDENSPKDMGQLIANLSRIQGDTDIHLLLTHHQPAEKERMRGHGALLGAVDTTIHVTKSATDRAAEVVKSSDHEEGQRIAFSLKSVTIGQDEHGDAVTSPVVVEEALPFAPAKKAALPAAAKVAINALQEAIDDLGAIPPACSHIPPLTKAVTMDQWRSYAYRLGISGSEEPRARQQAFDRALKTLQAAKAIGIWEPHVWLA